MSTKNCNELDLESLFDLSVDILKNQHKANNLTLDSFIEEMSTKLNSALGTSTALEANTYLYAMASSLNTYKAYVDKLDNLEISFKITNGFAKAKRANLKEEIDLKNLGNIIDTATDTSISTRNYFPITYLLRKIVPSIVSEINPHFATHLTIEFGGSSKPISIIEQEIYDLINNLDKKTIFELFDYSSIKVSELSLIGLNDLADKLTNKISDASNKIQESSSTNKAVANISTDKTALENKINAFNAHVSSLVNVLLEKISLLEVEKRTIEDSLKNLNDEITTQKNKLKGAETELSNSKAQLTELLKTKYL